VNAFYQCLIKYAYENNIPYKRHPAVSGVGTSVAIDIRLAEMLIEQKAVINPAELADPAVKLKKLLKK